MRPTKIQLDKKAKTLNVVWTDGNEQITSWKVLRERCPCATCRDEREKALDAPMSSLDIFTLKPMTSDDLNHIELVGNYAARLIWGDGHKSGIYGWQLLREFQDIEE